MKTQFHKRFPEINESEVVIHLCICSLKLKGLNIPGILYITEQRIGFYSTILGHIKRVSIRYDDIDYITKIDIGMLPLGLNLLSGRQKIKFRGFIRRDKVFKKMQSCLWEAHQKLQVIPDFQKVNSEDSGYASLLPSIGQMSLDRSGSLANHDFISLMERDCQKSLCKFWEDLQANPIVIIPISRSGNILDISTGSVTFKKSKWISFDELRKDESYYLGYEICLARNSDYSDEDFKFNVKLSLLVKSISNNQLKLIYMYRFEKGLAPLKMDILVQATTSEKGIEYQIKGRFEFDTLTSWKSRPWIEQLLKQQIERHCQELDGENQVLTPPIQADTDMSDISSDHIVDNRKYPKITGLTIWTTTFVLLLVAIAIKKFLL